MASNELKYSLLLTAQEKMRPALDAATAALGRVRAAGESLKATGANLRIARENVKSFADEGAGLIRGVLEPVRAVEAAVIDLRPALSRVSDDVEGSLARVRDASSRWSNEHSRSAAEYLSVARRMAESSDSEADAIKRTEIALRAATGARSDSVGTANTLNLLYESLGDRTNDWGYELDRIGDALVATRNIYGSAFDAGQLADPLKDAMGAARDARVPVEQLVGTIGALNAAGILGGESGAAAKNVIEGLLAAQDPLSWAISETADGQFDLAASLTSLREEFGELRDMSPEMLASFQEAFGPAWRDVSLLLAQGDRLGDNFEAIAESAFEAAKAQDAVDDSLTGRWAALDNQLLDLKVTVGEALIPAVKELAPTLAQIITPIADLVRQNPGLAAAAGKWALLSVGASSVLSPVLSAGSAFASTAGQVLEFSGRLGNFREEFPATAKAATSLGSGVSKAGSWIKSGFVPAAQSALSATLKWGAAMLANPITWIVLAIVAAAALIYIYWEPISAFFADLWADIAGVWKNVSAFFDSVFEPVPGIISGALQSVTSWLANFSLFAAGANILNTLTGGIKSMAHAPLDAVLSVVTKIRRLLPFSPAKDGPLRDLDKVKLIETVADAVHPAPLVTAMRSAALAGMTAISTMPSAGLSPMPDASTLSGGRAGAGGGVSIGSVTIQLQGTSDQSVVQQLEAWIANPANAENLARAVEYNAQRQSRAEFT